MMSNENNIVVFTDSSTTPFMTIGKRYEVLEFLKEYYLVKDDIGIMLYYEISQFTTLDEYRNNKINELLK